MMCIFVFTVVSFFSKQLMQGAQQKFSELYPVVFYQDKSVLPRIPEAHLKRQ